MSSISQLSLRLILIMSAIVPKFSRLSERVIRVLGCNPGVMTLQGTNTYIVGKGKDRVLIDTGDGSKPEYLDILRETLKKENINLTTILCTHWHYDHVGGIAGVLRIADNSMCRISKYPCAEHDGNDGTWSYSYLKDQDVVSATEASLKVHHTPGHTTDHLVVFLEEENALFSGDCILGEGSSVFEDLWSYMKSLEKILSLGPSVIYPGHGPVIHDPKERITGYISHRMEREKQILASLPSTKEDAITVERIVELVYKDTPRQLYGAAAGNVQHHLEKLTKDNKAGVLVDENQTKYWALPP